MRELTISKTSYLQVEEKSRLRSKPLNERIYRLVTTVNFGITVMRASSIKGRFWESISWHLNPIDSSEILFTLNMPGEFESWT